MGFSPCQASGPFSIRSSTRNIPVLNPQLSARAWTQMSREWLQASPVTPPSNAATRRSLSSMRDLSRISLRVAPASVFTYAARVPSGETVTFVPGGVANAGCGVPPSAQTRMSVPPRVKHRLRLAALQNSPAT